MDGRTHGQTDARTFKASWKRYESVTIIRLTWLIYLTTGRPIPFEDDSDVSLWQAADGPISYAFQGKTSSSSSSSFSSSTSITWIKQPPFPPKKQTHLPIDWWEKKTDKKNLNRFFFSNFHSFSKNVSSETNFRSVSQTVLKLEPPQREAKLKWAMSSFKLIAIKRKKIAIPDWRQLKDLSKSFQMVKKISLLFQRFIGKIHPSLFT